ncbi:M23 family metallopeptidase [Bdellovibrio sp. HCB337]|uniref:M23 family metallopeptidase n=1 Tax=Bdellovibrio sp. HCB337 TaxID=3394358 RepID=UPI0039A55550
MKYLYYFVLTSCFVFSLLSYQSALAGANGFIAKKVQTGDNVVSLLKQYRFSEAERSRVLAQTPSLHRLYLQLDVGYLVKQDDAQTELRLYDPQKDVVFVIKKTGKNIESKMARTLYKTTIARVDGKVRGSLMANILEKVNSNWVASRFMDAYIMDHNLNRGIERGANFWFTVEKKYDGPFFIRYGEILQTSLELRGRKLQKRFVKINTDGGVFISENDMIKNRPFYAPVDYLRIASLFQPNRRHPITRKVQPHLGIDFELPEGSPIYAARSGVVVRYGKNHAAGNYVVLLHPGGVETAYNHMSRLHTKIRRGLKLNAGEKLGEVGCTGYCTKAHLHFAVRKNGRMVDPLKYLRPYPIFAENLLHAKVAQF